MTQLPSTQSMIKGSILILLSILLLGLSSCKKTPNEIVDPLPVLHGKYANATDTITIKEEYYGYMGSHWKYDLIYPKFCDTLDYSQSSITFHPVDKAILLDNDNQRDSIIASISMVGTISGKFSNDTLTLHIQPYSVNTVSTYKYRKIQ